MKSLPGSVFVTYSVSFDRGMCSDVYFANEVIFFFPFFFFFFMALTHQERNESYKRFKRRIIQRRNSDVPSASTPWTSRWRREPGYEFDTVRHRLELDSPPGPREQAVIRRNSLGTATKTMHLKKYLVNQS